MCCALWSARKQIKMTTNFRELKVWERAIDIAERVYLVSSKFPRDEVYGLTSQVRRAVGSISFNIAEGSGRGTNKDFANFVSIALGSLREVQSQLILAFRLGYLDKEKLDELDGELEELARMLHGFRRYLRNKG